MPMELEDVVRECAEGEIKPSLALIEEFAKKYEKPIQKLRDRLKPYRPPEPATGTTAGEEHQKWAYLDVAIAGVENHVNSVTGPLRRKLEALVEKAVEVSNQFRVPGELITRGKVCPRVKNHMKLQIAAVCVQKCLDLTRPVADKLLADSETAVDAVVVAAQQS